ncbi:MAG: M20 family metallopeptidase [Chloroflexia bacterium]
MRELLDALNVRADGFVRELLAWCSIESPSEDEGATTRMAEVVAGRMAEAGAAVELLPGDVHGARVVARWAGAADQEPILLLGHHDTVHPLGSLAQNTPRVEGGRCYGPGGYDMKAGLLMAAAALGALVEGGRELPRPVVLISSADEEIGSADTRALIEETARGSAAVLVLEPAARDGALKTARKGVGMFTLTAHGRAAHAGVDHAAGVSAITELAHQVLALAAMTDYERGITLNVGKIRGGTARNTVAAEAVAGVDLRVSSLEDARLMTERILGLRPVLPGARLEVSGGVERPPMERASGTARLFALARSLGQEIGLDLRETSTGGGSDGNFTAALGVPTLDGLGTRGDGAHTDHEYVLIADLAPRAALLAGLVTHI